MNIFKALFHKHKAEKLECPFTMMTYTKCSGCGMHLKMPFRTNNG